MKKKGICGICPDKCWIEATIEDGKIVKVEPDKESPLGRICPRGALSPKIIYSDKRILRPLIRSGERGSGKFREAAWEEAVDYAAENFLKIKEKHGAQALVSYVGTSGREESTMYAFSGREASAAASRMRKKGFFENLGSPNDMTCGSTCFTAANVLAPVSTCGVPQLFQKADIENTELIFVWGKNPKTDSGALKIYDKIKNAQKRGAKLIVIDPRKDGAGQDADWWIPIIPGTDGALAIAMLKYIIENELYDKEFVENWTRGFLEFAQYLKTVSIKRMSAYCGISVDNIKKLTDLFCSTRKAIYFMYTGIEYQLSAVQNCRAVHILWGLTGKLDVEGGMYFNKDKLDVHPLSSVKKNPERIGEKEFPFFTKILDMGQFVEVPKAVLNGEPYDVRGLYIAAASPMTTYPDYNLWKEVYNKLDFIAVNERFMSEDARYADVIFPATTYYENESIVGSPMGLVIREKMIEPVGEAKNDIHILKALADRMGFGEVYPGENDEETLRWMANGNDALIKKLKSKEPLSAKPHIYKKYEKGILRADGEKGFPTPSGKFEISSSYIEMCGYTGYPIYKDIRDIMELGSVEEYPLVMTTGARSSIRFASFGPNIPEIAKAEPFPTVDISIKDAKEYGIRQGQLTEVKTVFGRKVYRANICEMASGCIHIPFGGGSTYMPKEWHEGNINEICSMNYHDELSGYLLYKSMPCQIKLNPIDSR